MGAGTGPETAGRERANHTAPAIAARAARCTGPRCPRGQPAADVATPSSHDTSSRVGTCRTVAGAPPTIPATSPPVSPHTMSGPATGTASRLAGTAATGTSPNVATSRGDTATWAASVTDRGPASHRGPGSRAARRPAPTTMPAAPATDSRKPSDVTSSGSTRTIPATPSASARSVDAGRPTAEPTAATDAMAVARSTDGSHRVSSANPASTARVATNRGPNRSRLSTGAAITSANATFCPDTASRWVRPAARKASVMSGGWWRSSPRVTPASRLRWRSGREAAPAARVRRRPLATRVTGSPTRQPVTVVISSRPARCRCRALASPDPGGRTVPTTVTRSPTSRPSRAAPAALRAWAASRRPRRRTSAVTMPP